MGEIDRSKLILLTLYSDYRPSLLKQGIIESLECQHNNVFTCLCRCI